MTRRRRRALWVVASLAALVLGVFVWAYFALESEWFFDKVRRAMITTVETATGGRVEIGGFLFDRGHLTAEVKEFILHGTEPADKPPLFRASSVKVGLKLISLLKPSVDILSLDVAEPHVYLVIGADGRTNIPEPKVKQQSRRNTIESILDLAIDRFHLHDGVFEIEAQGSVPIDFQGRNLAIQLAYDAAGPRYKGTLTAAPLDVRYSDYAPQPFTMNLGITLERNRIAIDSGKLATSQTSVEFSGALEDLAAPHARFQYTARSTLQDVARIFRVPELRRGTGIVAGSGIWNPAEGLFLTGNLHGTGVEYRDSTVWLTGYRADGAVEVGHGGVDVRGLRISGSYAHEEKREPLEGRIEHVDIRGRDINARGIALTLLGGTFTGEAHVRNVERYSVNGEIAGVQALRTVRLYSDEKLPWDALVYGPVHIEGAFHDAQALKAGGEFTLAPALTGDPVRGQINADYAARTRTLDLGRSAVTLPHSRVEFSGAIGRELRAHLETRDLNDLLPALGQSAAATPVKLNNGVATFDGSVTGDLSVPRISGHLRATSFTYSGESVDSFEGDVTAAPDIVRVQNGNIARGSLHAQMQGSVVLSDWKTTDASPIAGNGTIRNAPLADVLALADAKNVDATGTLTTTAYVTGSIGTPRVEGDLEVNRGAFRGEPFDRVTAHATYSGHLIEVRQGAIAAGSKVVRISGTFDHVPQHLDTGRLRFDVNTSAMPIESIHTVAEARPDVSGVVQATARGELQLDPAAKTTWRVLSLDADVTAKDLQLTGQPIGDAHLTAQSQGQSLRAHLDSTAAGSTVRGDGEWRLEGDYPGLATLTFSKVDLANLRAWVSPDATSRLSGSADGELRLEGPALNWKAMQAELRIPNFEMGPAPNTELASAPLHINNQGPIVARFANSIVTIESAHLIGRGTDLNVTGRILTEQKQPLDIRIQGHADLGFLQDFAPDVTARGTLVTNATVRGAFDDPQILGNVEFQKASFTITDVPNGISNATGVVVFTKDRATIQSLTGETGGGQIQLTGFAGYGGGEPIVFRLHASARSVRVRYPEGVSTLADANLTFTGTEESSTLAGNIVILRTGVNLQSDFSSILAKSAEPVRTPSAQPGLLGGMSFDVQVETAPETQFESTLTEGIQAEANLRVRGTLTNPAVLGRISITQGKLTFFGTQYTLSQGTISFFNPIKVEPILNIDLETKARGIDITLTVSGPLTKLTLTPRSDPPLQFSEIIALLAQGRAPASDPSLLRRQADAPQTFQQAGASALLGSAIANPVAGRLQRFFGVSKLRIDPSLSGVENNPQARLTLEQQITPTITFTYITNVTQSNPQVVRIEWAVSKEWSVVGLREENGLLGLDFFYKRRFK